MELLYASKYLEEMLARVALAQQLGHKTVIVLFTERAKEAERDVLRKAGATIGILIEHPARAAALARHYEALIGRPRRDHFESKHLTHILDPEEQPRPDFIHHRNSGLNQVTLKLARARGITLLSTLSALAKNPAQQFGRLQQNLRWCKKYGVNHYLVSGARAWHEQRAPKDLEALRRVLMITRRPQTHINLPTRE